MDYLFCSVIGAIFFIGVFYIYYRTPKIKPLPPITFEDLYKNILDNKDSIDRITFKAKTSSDFKPFFDYRSRPSESMVDLYTFMKKGSVTVNFLVLMIKAYNDNDINKLSYFNSVLLFHATYYNSKIYFPSYLLCINEETLRGYYKLETIANNNNTIKYENTTRNLPINPENQQLTLEWFNTKLNDAKYNQNQIAKWNARVFDSYLYLISLPDPVKHVNLPFSLVMEDMFGKEWKYDHTTDLQKIIFSLVSLKFDIPIPESYASPHGEFVNNIWTLIQNEEIRLKARPNLTVL